MIRFDLVKNIAMEKMQLMKAYIVVKTNEYQGHIMISKS